jgi:hypothetical protein
MHATILDEPNLEFGGGAHHVDPRAGVADYGPADLGITRAPGPIRIGFVGPDELIDGALKWLESCRHPINARPSRHPTLFRGFPGFDIDRGYHARLDIENHVRRPVGRRALARAVSKPGGLAVAECVELYEAQIADLDESNRVDVTIVCRPDELHDDARAGSKKTSSEEDSSAAVDERNVDFHDLLKSRLTGRRTPTQLVRSSTWDPTRSGGRDKRRGIQDEATRAWNFHTAMYYKAGGVPWRLERTDGVLSSLYVGISFFHTPDRSAIHTSVAQVFDELGSGVVVRGGPVVRRQKDRQPHLGRVDAEALVGAAIDAYRREHHTQPARVVVHKTSSFDDEETMGIESALDARSIDHADLVWVLADSERCRLFRNGENSVLRGTFVELDAERQVLFTRGSVEYYRTYPGMYIPVPIGLRPALTESDPLALAREVLALSKMNWNQSQLDGRLPITLSAARKIAGILKHVPDGRQVEGRYASFM